MTDLRNGFSLQPEKKFLTGFTIQLDYDYHVNDSIQYHDASQLYQIYCVHFY